MKSENYIYTDEEIKDLFQEIFLKMTDLSLLEEFNIHIYIDCLRKFEIIKKHKNLYWHMEGFQESYKSLKEDLSYLSECIIKVKNRKEYERKMIKQQLGNYLLLDTTYQEVDFTIYRALYLRLNADKIVTVKIQNPNVEEDQSSRNQIINEITSSYNLTHPNFAQIYDYGEYQQTLYLVREYIDGKSLDDFFKKLKAKKYLFPPEISLQIIIHVCQALYSIHSMNNLASNTHGNLTSKSINITYDGEIKITDFQGGKEHTHKDDQFAVACLLWEMLCNNRYLKPEKIHYYESNLKCLRALPPPSSQNSSIPLELDEVILKALSLNEDDRYENINIFSLELLDILHRYYTHFNPNDVACFTRDIFLDEIKLEREIFYQISQMDISRYLLNIKKKEN